MRSPINDDDEEQQLNLIRQYNELLKNQCQCGILFLYIFLRMDSCCCKNKSFCRATVRQISRVLNQID